MPYHESGRSLAWGLSQTQQQECSVIPLHFWEPKSIATSGPCTATHGPHVPSKALFFLWPHFPPIKQKSFARKSLKSFSVLTTVWCYDLYFWFIFLPFHISLRNPKNGETGQKLTTVSYQGIKCSLSFFWAKCRRFAKATLGKLCLWVTYSIYLH